jgi:immune inhibitor A
MVSKKLLSVMTSLFLLAGVGGTSSSKGQNLPVPEQVSSIEQGLESPGGPSDLSIANEEKVIEMLKKEGKIAKDAAYTEAQKVYLRYMQDVAKANQKMQPSKMERDLMAKQNQKVQKYKFDQSKPDTNPKKVNVLVLLADFQDYKHNSIQTDETDMYYKDYSNQHYQDMIFGDKVYVGPNGENLISMKQYYAQQSGGSLNVEGKVAGWYTLPNTAAYYGAAYGSSNDIRPRNAVADVLKEAAKDPNINFADFDEEDIYDLDGDGNYNEPDGIIDYRMVLHAGVGQEAGGGSLGSNAIWSHSWDLGGLYGIPGTTYIDNKGKNNDVPYMAYHYTIEPEDGAAGVFAHEFGHNLGVPDEYDIAYSSAAGEPVSFWSIMSSGSWGGTIPGTEPIGFSPYAKQIFQALYGGNWQKQVVLDFNKLTTAGVRVDLRQADEQGQVVRINLPDRTHTLVTPTSGKYAYWGGKGEDGISMLTNITTKIDLTGKTVAILKFKTSYDIETGWDFATVQARVEGTNTWTYLAGNITTDKHDPDAEVIVPYGITGASKGWVDGVFDLSAFAGKKVELKLEYQTDAYSFGDGFYVDDIQVIADNNVVLSDDVEGTSTFTLNGFQKNTGSVTAPNYYLVEWRNHHGVDTALAHIGVLGQNLSYDPGMVVWYVDKYYTERDNLTGVHPGDGYLGIVDADQKSVIWNFADGKTAPLLASGRYQMHDAAFSNTKEAAITVNTDTALGRSPVDNYRFTEPNFTDSTNYLNPEIPSLGRNIPKLGLKIQITNQAADNSSASLTIMK